MCGGYKVRKGLMGVHNKKLELDHTIYKFVSVIIFMYIKQHLLFLCALVLVLCSGSFVGLNSLNYLVTHC